MGVPTVMLSQDCLTVVAYRSCTLPCYSLHERISPRNSAQMLSKFLYKYGDYRL